MRSNSESELLHSIQYNTYNIVVYITWALYIITVLGISASAPDYLETLNSIVKIYVSLFLIYRFNPFRTVRFTALDGKIAFSAGTFLLTTTAINQILKTYLSDITMLFKRSI